MFVIDCSGSARDDQHDRAPTNTGAPPRGLSKLPPPPPLMHFPPRSNASQYLTGEGTVPERTHAPAREM